MTIKAAVVGVGYLGQYHAEKYAKSANADLVAVVDVETKVAKKIAKKCKTKAEEDYKVLPALGVNCASIASTTSTHFEIAKFLLESGVDVLVEKPVTTTVEEAKQLIEIARANDRILQVGHLERFNPAFCEMKKVLDRPGFFEARRISPFSGRGADVDVVLDLMIHDIDIIAHLVGRPLLRVDAIGVPLLTESIDVANARLTFEGGTVANVTASRAAFKSERTIRVFQPDRYISLDYQKKTLKMYRKSAKGLVGSIPKIDVDEYRVEERDALADEIESFLACVQTRQVPEVTGEDGLKAMELAALITREMTISLESILGGAPLADEPIRIFQG